jgi:hypothetical protein
MAVQVVVDVRDIVHQLLDQEQQVHLDKDLTDLQFGLVVALITVAVAAVVLAAQLQQLMALQD